MKLISMTDFVLEQENKYNTFNPKGRECELQKRYNNIFHYANFLKQPLELWMFIPCDEDGNVLKEPDSNKFTMDNVQSFNIFIEQLSYYQQAKERCLFDGFLFSVNKLIGDFQEILILPFSDRNLQFHITDFTKEKPKSKKIIIVEDLIDYDLQLTKTAEKLIGL